MSNDSSGQPNTAARDFQASAEGHQSGNWQDAIPSLIASRLGIFRIEAQDALDVTIRKLIGIGMALFCLFATWSLLTAGLIGVMGHHFNCPWYLAAFFLGGFYLLISLMILLIIKRTKKIESFPVTRAEFEKDRQWLNQLRNRSNSQS